MNRKTIDLLLGTLAVDPSNWDIRLHIVELLRTLGADDEAKALLNASDELPAEEGRALALVEQLRHLDKDKSLEVLDCLITRNKACAPAYMLKASIYRELGQRKEARKLYNVAAVIDESLEDDDFEAWLDGEDSSNTEITAAIPSRPLAVASLGGGPQMGGDGLAQEDIPDPDEFIETDAALDKALNASHKWIDFTDIGGMEQLKERVRMSIIYPFKNKELFAKFKKRSGGGLLFYGPPGCGKTLISRATAGECGAHFINISVHDILSKWIGESEQRIHALFEEARRKSPTIIFIDEVDALGVKRSDAGHTATLVNTLLTEMDGSQSDNQDVLVLGATNTPWRVDSAFRRPGRFDHVLFVPPPDHEARTSILEIILADIPQDKLDLNKLAKLTEKFSGADLRAVVERATEAVIQDIMRTGKEVRLTQKHLTQSIKQMRPTTLEWLEQASNYASYANQSGLYDDLSDYIKSL